MSDQAAKAAQPAEPKQLATTQADRQLLCARFSPDGTLVAAGGMDATVRRWKVDDAKLADLKSKDEKLLPLPAVNGHDGWVSQIAFAPAAPLLYSADSWGQLRCNDFTGANAKIAWKIPAAHDGWIRQVCVSPDGNQIATGGRDQFLRLWSTDGKKVTEKKHTEEIYALQYAPGGGQLVFGDFKGVLRLWDPKADKVIREFDASVYYAYLRLQEICGLRHLAFMDEGRTLVAAGTTPSNGGTVQGIPTIQFFDFATGKLKRTVKFGVEKDCFIEDIAIHPDGYVMAVTSGVPGSGLLAYVSPAADKPLLTYTKIANYHSLALRPGTKQFLVTATNKGSNGNGRRLTKDGEYAGNSSPLHLFEMPV